MEFIPIDLNKHREYIIPFRRDSFIVSFGTDKDFGMKINIWIGYNNSK